MAEFETEIYRNMQDVRDLLDQLKGLEETKFALEYQSLKDDLEFVNNRFTELSPEGENQIYPEFTEKDLSELKKCYYNISKNLGRLDQALNSLKVVDPNTNEPVSVDVVHSLEELVAKDSYTFSRMQPGLTFQASLEAAQTPKVDIGNTQLGTTGGQQSSRIPMTIRDGNGHEIKGFFTREAKFDMLPLWNNMVSSIKKKYGVKISAPLLLLLDAYMKNLKNSNPDKFGRDADYNRRVALTAIFEYFKENRKENIIESIRNLMNDALPDIMRSPLFELHFKGKNLRKVSAFEKLFFDFSEEIRKLNTVYVISDDNLGLKLNDNIDKRNSAMSMVADMLGIPNVIAHAEPMKILENGKEVEGTFMENAEGNDVCNPSDRSKKKKEHFLNSNGYKDLADLQILDYITGNVDRHMGNMFYKFDKKGKFTGVQGIDNDSSFGTRVLQPNERLNRLPMLSEMKYISQSVYNKVKELDPDVLRTSLHNFALPSDQISACCARLDTLKSYLKDNARKGRKNANNQLVFSGEMMIVEDDKFQELKIFSPVIPKVDPNYITYMASYNSVLSGGGKSKLRQPLVNIYDPSAAYNLSLQSNEFGRQLKNLNSVDHWYISSSPSFRDMKEALENLRSLTEAFKKKDLTPEGYEKIALQLDILNKKANEYIDNKEKEPHKSPYAMKRLRFVKAFVIFAQEKEEEFGTKIKESMDKKANRDAYASRVIENIRNDLKNNGLTKETAVHCIRNANLVSRYTSATSQEAVLAMDLVSKAAAYLMDHHLDNKAGLTKDDIRNMKETLAKGRSAQKTNKKKPENVQEVARLEKKLGSTEIAGGSFCNFC